MRLESYRQKVNELKARRLFIVDSLAKEKKSLETAQQEMDDVEEARVIVQSIAQTIQQKVHSQISDIVTKCLQSVFDDSYEFKIRFEKKRGKTEALLVFARDGREYDDPLNDVGGGVIDVAALGLRLACVLMSRPLRRRLLVLDEPFRNVRGKGNKQRLRSLLVGLSDDVDFQFILNVDVDSYPEFVLGKIIDMGS